MFDLKLFSTRSNASNGKITKSNKGIICCTLSSALEMPNLNKFGQFANSGSSENDLTLDVSRN